MRRFLGDAHLSINERKSLVFEDAVIQDSTEIISKTAATELLLFATRILVQEINTEYYSEYEQILRYVSLPPTSSALATWYLLLLLQRTTESCKLCTTKEFFRLKFLTHKTMCSLL